MTVPAAGAVGAALVLVGWGAWRWRPAPTRARRLATARRLEGHPGRGLGPPEGRASWVAMLGRVVRRRFGRAPDAAADRRLGWALVAGAALAPVSAAAPAAVALWWWAAPLVARRRERRRQDAAVQAELPEVVDLFVLAVGAGLTVALAVPSVARHERGHVGTALDEVARRARLGARLADALADLPVLVGERARPLANVLVASERYGVALLPALERLATETRLDRRRAAEAAARRVPVKLLFPLVLCTLPAFALLTVVPLLAGSLRSLRL